MATPKKSQKVFTPKRESCVSFKKKTSTASSHFFLLLYTPSHVKKFLLDEKSCWCQKMLFITCHQDGDTKAAQVAASSSAVVEELLLLLRWQHGTYKKSPFGVQPIHNRRRHATKYKQKKNSIEVAEHCTTTQGKVYIADHNQAL